MAPSLEVQQDLDNAASSSCSERFPVQHSPLSDQSNGFLQTDGVLVRAYDVFDRSPETVTKYIPASYLHATMRAARVIYDFDDSLPSFAVLVGSKYATNNNSSSVGCNHFYPTDSNSVGRGVIEDPPRCVRKFVEQTCQMGKCLMDLDQCDKCNVAGSEVAPMIRALVERRKKKRYERRRPKLENLFFKQCWFDDWKEAITAANDLWLTRSDWWDPNEEVIARQSNLHADYRYEGWTECRANSAAIQDLSMMDAVVITVKHAASLCDVRNQTALSAALHVAQHVGYENLPVLLFREAKGSTNGTADYCNRWWDGQHCDDSWTKEFFAQEFDFEDGSCLRRRGYDDEAAYFYPNCSVTTVSAGGGVLPPSHAFHGGGMAFEESLPNGSRELALLSLLVCALLRCRRKLVVVKRS